MMKVTAARRAAFETLWRVEKEEAYASNLLAAARFDELSREDHGLLQELTLGVLRWQGQLDFLIARHARRPLGELDPEVVIALRLGLYQLLHLTRIPAHAALNESVNLVKERGRRSAAPLVNAILRAAQRGGPGAAAEMVRAIADARERLSVETSHPAWLLARWVARFGEEEARALALANNAAPSSAFRFNSRRAPEEVTRAWLLAHEISVRDSALAPGAAVIEAGRLSAQSEPVLNGWIYFQDEASQLTAHVAASHIEPFKSRIRLLDLCAAPGSKTTLMANLLPADAVLVAGDLHPHRLRTMRSLAARLGAGRVTAVRLDAAGELPFADGAFDVVLLDAPCSGLGTLQRHPEIKWRVSQAKVGELAALQGRLIGRAARLVRAGGLLIYAVCSTEAEEGEEVVAEWRAGHAEYRDVTRERLLEIGLDPGGLLTPTYGARTFTHRQGAESFFFCALWRRR